ncbi:MAG: PhzF family phenazine biosynthesis protein [Rhodospirillales bacterium]|nr:PhzF family phenazine biosynthesis protein [Rhodospirillales bacterium]MBT4039194.1 PhzF family phenazine biosynthesis protein [Rhodospirillales bacterium]MBT4625607.1 PhzF family phenazine biosynthesis protein [Rhodospirillales bacterium]MBT5351480.1 PhzF family phenazine biosynthesis protein [Rhodospirillales bacterium]MBT5521437.1 PhzF family phenazine biosynthesis protein [Rhodospirillales bacterium]
MTTVPFALYDAFTDMAFGGSQAGVITDAADIDEDTRIKIAREIGAPATSFVSAYDQHSVTAQFYSTVMELPMCGHGTMCLMTHMLDLGMVGEGVVTLNLPKNTATVELSRRDDGRARVMLDIKSPTFRTDDLDLVELAGYLGIADSDYRNDLPIETAAGDFIHLVVPVKDLATMQRITPDLGGIKQFCLTAGLETVAVFSTEVEQEGYTIHVRDFCPAVGVAESAAAGTTNAALTSYLIRHEMVTPDVKGEIVVQAEQGHEIERPSSIRSVVAMDGTKIQRLQVGGVATRVLDGNLYV